jgi:hypothetical protein
VDMVQAAWRDTETPLVIRLRRLMFGFRFLISSIAEAIHRKIHHDSR